MAGSYPDAPGQRMAYDEDGTVMWKGDCGPGQTFGSLQTGTIAYITGNTLRYCNEEDTVSTYTGRSDSNYGYSWIFSEQRDIYGWNLWVTTGGSTAEAYNIQLSPNSRDGITGSWTILDDYYPNPSWLLYAWDTWYRLGINAVAGLAATSFRFVVWGGPLIGGAGTLWRCHIYGNISAGYTPNRLLFIDQDTGLEFTAPLDWGDVPRGVVLDHDIKVKNNSGTLTASTNQITFQDISQTSDTWYTIKETGGGAFGSSLSIASIAAGVTYPSGGNVITIRLTVADDETVGPQAARAKLTTGTWA